MSDDPDDSYYDEGEIPDEREDADAEPSGPAESESDDSPDMGDLFDDLAELEAAVDSPEERERVRETMRTAMEVRQDGVFGRVVSGFDRSDAAEALLGALLFGIPMFVEGGTQEVGIYISDHPLYLVATNAMAIGLVIGILYVADFQDVRVQNPILGIFPRKLVGVLTIASTTAVFMMTAWGRVDWGDPWLTVCQISVAFVPMAIGAALGDLLPG